MHTPVGKIYRSTAKTPYIFEIFLFSPNRIFVSKIIIKILNSSILINDKSIKSLIRKVKNTPNKVKKKQ